VTGLSYSTLTIVLVGVLATEPWRWAGLLLARRITVDGPLFRLARAVSNAIVAAFVARLLADPPGPLGDTPALLRLAAAGFAIAAFAASGQRLWAGVLAGVATLGLGLLFL
jgi:Branched-chain amino acid transport protein (AzlD)